MIAVTGATGTIGSALLPYLSERDVRVRALTRDVSGRAGGDDVEWVEVDLADRAATARALEGADRLFLLTGNAEAMVRLQKNAVRAAVEAGVERVVKLSALGASDHSKSVIGLWHHSVERYLRESTLEWTLLRPHHFMQNLLDPLVFDRESEEVRSASGEGRIPFVDTRDVAEVAAVVLTEDGHTGETYTLTGPEALSYREVTELLAEAVGRPIRYVPESMDEAWRRHRAAGQPVWLAAAQLAIAGYQREGGPTERVSDAVNRRLGRPPRTVRGFLEDHVEAFWRGG